MGAMKSIYEYTDYREFLRDWCTHARNGSSSFSYRNFARQAEISSPGFLKMVMDGKRNLAPDTVRRFAKVLKLREGESRFFWDLVMFNQAKTNEEKNDYYQKIARNRRFRKAHHITRDHFEYLGKWYYAAIREMVALPDFAHDPAWIARRLRPSISKAEASAALEVLLRLGFIKYNDEGRLETTDEGVRTDDEVVSLAAANFHREMIKRAHEALSLFRAKDRNISSLTVAMSKESFRKLANRIHDFRKEVLALLEEGGDPDGVYQLNLQLFSLTEGNNES